MNWIAIAIVIIASVLVPFAIDFVAGLVDEWRMRRRLKRRVAAIRAWNEAVKAWEKGEQAPGWKVYGGYADKGNDGTRPT